MKIIERLFRQVHAAPGADDTVPRPFRAYFHHPAIVVLGDPGAGKTTVFQQAAEEEEGAVPVSVRDFLALSADRWRGRTLYLDGLDEERAKTPDGRTTLDAVRGRLDELGKPSFRLSCRSADWYGASDAEKLRMVARDGVVVVLDLLPLTNDDIRAIVEAEALDGEAFIRRALETDVQHLLANPQNLSLFLTVVRDGPWPETRSELFDRATRILLREVNEEHLRAEAARVPLEAIRDAASAICAVMLCGGEAGIALSRSVASSSCPFVEDLPGDPAALRLAPRTRVFQALGAEQVEPVHRSFAEYLTATDLARRIPRGLSLDRVLALLTGDDGGTFSDLRGVYAWLATVCPDHSERLLRRDPLGVILYGDATSLPVSVKRVALAALREEAHRHPWFRVDALAADPFAGLASSDTEGDLRDILRDASSPPALLSCVLDALRSGPGLPALAGDVLRIIRDDQQASAIRVAALKALARLSDRPFDQLRHLLEDVHQGRVLDPDRELRGFLLSTLFPAQLGVVDVVSYLVPPSDLIGRYLLFLDQELVPRTPPDDVPLGLDALVSAFQRRPAERSDVYGRFVDQMLLRGLQECGDAIDPDRLFGWLGLALDQYGRSAADQPIGAQIRQWLDERPAVIRALFQRWLSVTATAELDQKRFDFWRHLQDATSPVEFGQWLLSQCADEPDPARADFLFREAVSLRMSHDRSDAPTLEEIYALAASHPRFQQALKAYASSEIPAWRREEAVSIQQVARRRVTRRADHVSRLSPRLDAIRAGRDVGPLEFLAKVWFGLFIDLERTLAPQDRLRVETNDDIAAAAVTGFVAALHSPGLPSADQIGEADADSRTYMMAPVILAGMDIAFTSATGQPTPPRAAVEAAVAFHLTYQTNTPHAWVDGFAESVPEIVAGALLAFWRPHLGRRTQHIRGLSLVERDGPCALACSGVTTQLLREFRTTTPDSLRTLLRGALRFSPRKAVLEVVQRALGQPPTTRGAVRTLWLTAGFVLAPSEFGPAFLRGPGRTKEGIRLSLDLIAGNWPGERSLLPTLPAASLAELARVAGRYFAPAEIASGAVRLDDDRAMGEIVATIIQCLGQNPSQEATVALASLRDDRKLKAWRDPISHHLAVQVRNRRDAEFRYPTVEAVVGTLQGGPAANIRDLRALTAWHLREIGEELRHGSTDGYKALWNDDGRRLTRPKAEVDCRDRMLDRLRPRLSRVGVIAEPEGRHADRTLADIKVMVGSLSLPVEVKCHYHRELWTAARDQLRQRYARDPGSRGHGIYLVLWFGLDHRSLPTPPEGIPYPASAGGLEHALASTLPPDDHAMIEIIVFDVSRPKKRPRGSRR